MDTNTTNTFWQANFWGIVGSITGIAGLIVGWFSFRYNTPKVEIEEATLMIPDWIFRDWKEKTVEQLKNSVLEFELEIVVRNGRGGSGSIDKPLLVIKIPDGKRYRIFRKLRYIKIRPVTEHFESEKESENLYKTWTERHGRSFNLVGGEKADARLTYQTYKYPKNIFDYIKFHEKIEYLLEYKNNTGKKRQMKIKKIVNETDQHS